MANFTLGSTGTVKKAANQRTTSVVPKPPKPGQVKATAVSKEEFAATAAPFLGHTADSTMAAVLGAPDDEVRDLMLNRPKGASLLGARRKVGRSIVSQPGGNQRANTMLGSSATGILGPYGRR